MADKLIGVRFYNDAGPHDTRATMSSKKYSYLSSMQLEKGDVVIVRTYDDKNGPLKFAVVESISNPFEHSATSYPLRRIIQKLDFSAVEAEEQRIEQIKAAEALLKRKVAERSQVELFNSVADQMTAEEQNLVRRALNLVPNGDSLSNKELREAAVHSLNGGPMVRVQALTLEHAIGAVASTRGVPEHTLTARWW